MISLFDRLGGEAGLTRLLDLLYQRLLDDDYLGEYFMGVDVDRLKMAQAAFLRQAFGDPGAEYAGRKLHIVHRNQMITEQAFDQFIDMFVEATGELGADAVTQADARAALWATRASVLMEFSPNPEYDYKAKPF
jgi:hemoglobin